MTAHIETSHRKLSCDLARPLPISIPMRHGSQNPVAWYAEYPSMTPVKMGDFVGSVALGGNVNTRDITFNPHGNGTHTECIGHITEAMESIDDYMREYWHIAKVVTAIPMTLAEDKGEFCKTGDLVIELASFSEGLDLAPDVKALVIRTSPNSAEKLTRTYSNANPPYLSPELMHTIREAGIEHLLVDLPSVDREQDGGRMLAHRAFWYDQAARPRVHATITEMVYVPDEIADGEYMINIMVSPLKNDASPSKPVLYPILG